MAHISRLDPYAPTAPVSLETALDYLEQNRGIVSTLVLSTGPTARVFTRVRPWSYLEAEAEAKFWEHDNFTYLNTDGSKAAAVMTGTGRRARIHRRQLSVVA